MQVVRTALKLVNRLDHRDKGIIFVEPSCGDGRIIIELLRILSTSLLDPSVIGYDIDSSAINRSIQNITKIQGTKLAPIFKCNNFLSTSLQDLHQDLDLTNESNHLTIVIGGPPYTPRDLPERFIMHSIYEYCADVVVFILPERCRKDADRIQKILNDKGRTQWYFVNRDLANITFDFQGSLVMQPSFLQYWHHM
jgi:hypothetical protein